MDLGKQTSKDQLGLEHTLTMALIFANNLANPFIYVACRKRYRNSLKLLCFGQCNGVAPANNSAFVVVWTRRTDRTANTLREEEREAATPQFNRIEVYNL